MLRLTDEHIFPAALGGNLVLTGASCIDCNHGSSKFEQLLAVELTPIRTMFQIPDRYGKVPNTAAEIITPVETYKGWVKSDGNAVASRHVTQEVNEKGEREFVHRFVTDEQKEKLRKDAERRGKRLVELSPGEPVTAEVRIGGKLEAIGSQSGLQTAAKIAYVRLAHLLGINAVVSDAFSKVRQFVLEGKPAGIARIFTNQNYISANQQGPHQHSVAIAARRDKRRVDAIVRLFGELTYFVILSEDYDGADFCNTLLYDAYRGEEDNILFGHIQAELLYTEDVVTSKETTWDNLEIFGRNFCAFLERVVTAKELANIPERTPAEGAS